MPEHDEEGPLAGHADGTPPVEATAVTPEGDQLLLVDLDWRPVVAFIAAGMALLAGATVLRSVPRTMTWLVIGGLLALALDPVVGRLAAALGNRRRAAVGIVLLAMLLVIVLVGFLLGPETIRQARSVQEDIPKAAEQLADLPFIGDRLAEEDVPQKVEDWIDGLPDRLAGDSTAIEGAAKSTASGILAGFVTLLFTVTLLLDGQRLMRGIRRMVPMDDRPRADRLGRLLYVIVGRYFAGSVFVAVLHGLYVLVLGLILGVPLTPLLALWAIVWNLVPQIGGAVAGAPFVVMALTQGLFIGLIAAVLFVLYLNLENHIITPVVVGRALDLSPIATMVGAIVGVSVAGVPGALVAVPLMGASKAIYREVRGQGEGEEDGEEQHLPGASLLKRFRTRFGPKGPVPSSAVALVVLALVVGVGAACSDGGGDDAEPSIIEQEGAAQVTNPDPVEGTLTADDLPEDFPDVCSIVTTDEVAEVTGFAVERSELRVVDDTTAMCTHLLPDGSNSAEVELSRPDDGGAVLDGYAELDGAEEVSDLGERAVWSAPLDTIAVLSADSVVTVLLVDPDGEADHDQLREQAAELAQTALGNL